MQHTLQILSLEFNQIESLETSGIELLSNLNVLNLHSNKLKQLPKSVFINMRKSLRLLSLYNNTIETLEETGIEELTQLEELWLKDNKLRILPQSTFLNMHNSLRVLRLTNNAIETLEKTSIQELSNLKELNIDVNKLEALPVNIFVNMKNSLLTLTLDDWSVEQLVWNDTGINSVKGFVRLQIGFGSSSLSAKCAIYSRFRLIKFNRKILERQYYNASFLEDSSFLSIIEECEFMLYFLKHKIVFNHYSNSLEKIHNCIDVLHKDGFYSKSWSSCDVKNKKPVIIKKIYKDEIIAYRSRIENSFVNTGIFFFLILFF
jgi:hypothetical protein